MNKPLSRDEMIGVAWRARPFDGPVRRGVVVRENERWPTILEIVASTEGLPPNFMAFGECRINDHKINRDLWHCVHPRLIPGQEVAITLLVPMQGPGGANGQKNILATVASIAVLLIAAAVSGGALGLPAIGLLSATAVNSVAGAAVGIVGALTIGALSPPPKLAAAQTAVTDAEGRPASLTANVMAPGAAVPRAIGTRKMFLPPGCEALNELVGNDERVEVVLVAAGPHALSDPRADGVAFADITDIAYELQEGLDGVRQSLVQRQGRTIQKNLELSRHKIDKTIQNLLENQSTPDLSTPQWHTFVTRFAPDEVWLRHIWPEGLFRETAPTSTICQAFRYRFRRRGDSSWINCPEVHFCANKPGPFQKDVRFKWGTMPAAPTVPPGNQGPVYVFKHVSGQDGATVVPATSDWDAASSFSGGAGNDLLSNATLATSNVRNVEMCQEKVIFYLDAATFPQDAQYEIQVRRSSPYLAVQFTASTYITVSEGGIGTHVFDFFEYSIQGSYAVPFDQATIHDRVIIRSVSSVWNENPIQSDDFATLSVIATGQTLNSISVIASGYTMDWDGSGWNTLTTTSNPAPHFRDVLCGRLGSDPMPEDMVTDAELVAWRTYCDDAGLTCDIVIDGRNGDDVLKAIAAAGRARPRMTESWGVAVNKDVSDQSVVQIFSPRNMRSFGFSKAFTLPTTGFRVQFDDIDNDYVQDQIIVDDPDAPATANTRYEDLRLDTVVENARAIDEALFQLKQARLQLAVLYNGEVPAEGLVCYKGDLVGVQHDVIDGRAGFARIKSVTRSAPNVTGLVLDGTIPFASSPGLFSTSHLFAVDHLFNCGARAGVAIRLLDGSSIIKEFTAVDDDQSALTFVSPFTDPGVSLDEDCLVVVGALGTEYSRMRVLESQPTADLVIQISFVPEAPELFGNPTAYAIARDLGLADNLVLCLDAGDVDSFVSGAQRWYDTSGQGNDFWVGVSATVGAGDADPTFNGSTDGRSSSEFFYAAAPSLMDEVAVGAWELGLHKDGAAFTFVAIYYPTTTADDHYIVNQSNSAANIGTGFFFNTSNPPVAQLKRSNGSAQTVNTLAAGVMSAWNFYGVAVDENGGAAGSHYRIGSSTGTFDGGLSSPSASSPTQRMRAMGNREGGHASPTGDRLMAMMAFNRKLSSAELSALYGRWKLKRMPGLI